MKLNRLNNPNYILDKLNGGINMVNIFTFLKDNKVYAEIRAGVLELLVKKGQELQAFVEQYVKEKSPEVKEATITWVMDHIELKFPYKLFKGKIKKALDKNFDKVIEFILAKIQEI